MDWKEGWSQLEDRRLSDLPLPTGRHTRSWYPWRSKTPGSQHWNHSGWNRLTRLGRRGGMWIGLPQPSSESSPLPTSNLQGHRPSQVPLQKERLPSHDRSLCWANLFLTLVMLGPVNTVPQVVVISPSAKRLFS